MIFSNLLSNQMFTSTKSVSAAIFECHVYVPTSSNTQVGHPCGAMACDGSACRANVSPESISMYCPDHSRHTGAGIQQLVSSTINNHTTSLVEHDDVSTSFFIKLITLTGRSIDLEIDSADTLENIQDKILDMDGEPLAPYSLILAGKELTNDDTIISRLRAAPKSGEATAATVQLAVPCGAMSGGGSACGRWSAPGELHCTHHVGSRTELTQYPKLQCQARTSSGSQCPRVIQDGSNVCTQHQPPTHREGISCMSKTLRGTMCTRDRTPGCDFCRQHGTRTSASKI